MQKSDLHLPYFPVPGKTTLQRWKEMRYGEILCNEEQFSAYGNEKICPSEIISNVGLVLFIMAIPAGAAVRLLLESTLPVANYAIIIPAMLFTFALFQYILPKFLLVLVPWVSRNTDKKSEKMWALIHEQMFRSVVLLAEVLLTIQL